MSLCGFVRFVRCVGASTTTMAKERFDKDRVFRIGVFLSCVFFFFCLLFLFLGGGSVPGLVPSDSGGDKCTPDGGLGSLCCISFVFVGNS